MISLLLAVLQAQPILSLADAQPTQQKLDALSDKCGTPHTWLQFIGDHRVWIRFAPTAKYEDANCVLRELKASNLDVDLGFVGNEIDPSKANQK